MNANEVIANRANQILGGAPQQVATLSVWRQDDPDDLVLRATELLEQIDAGDGVLVLTDIFGATPGNVVSRASCSRPPWWPAVETDLCCARSHRSPS